MYYFIKNKNSQINKIQGIIKKRKRRKFIFSVGKSFNRGDILTINFWTKTILYHFEGICLSVKNKFFTKPNVSLTLRNVLFSVGIEMSVSYYINRIFKNIFMSDYKRKKFQYRSSKLYYLRLKKNKSSKIKN